MPPLWPTRRASRKGPGSVASRQRRRARVIFITGTDTGVGKTILTALLLHHLRHEGVRALATKPFQSGGGSDGNLLFRLQNRELTRDEVSPFCFTEPLAPVVAGRLHRRCVRLSEVMKHVRRLQVRGSVLLVEGIGGVLVPLGEGYSVLDLIRALKCCVIVVARNRVGTINHTLLTVAALRRAGIRRLKIVLNDTGESDASARWNARLLAETLGAGCVYSIPFLGHGVATAAGTKESYRKVKKTLARVAGFDSFTPLFGTAPNAASKTTC